MSMFVVANVFSPMSQLLKMVFDHLTASDCGDNILEIGIH